MGPLHIVAHHGHAAVMKQLIQARCIIHLQQKYMYTTPLHIAAQKGHAAVAQMLLAARCNIDLEGIDGLIALQTAQRAGPAAIATLIRNTKQKGAKDVLLQASPREDKKETGADWAMRELWEKEVYKDRVGPWSNEEQGREYLDVRQGL